MTDEQLMKHLESEGYYDMRVIEGRGICGLYRFIFTTGLVYGITELFYEGRYCYSNHADAKAALEAWNGEGDPEDEYWIKHKGRTEYSNPKNKTQ